MTLTLLTLRERLHQLLPAQSATVRGVPIRITAASECRQDLTIVILDEGHWSVFDPNTADVQCLGDIVRDDGRFLIHHELGANGYRFDEFRQALTYFMEYGYALSLGRTEP